MSKKCHCCCLSKNVHGCCDSSRTSMLIAASLCWKQRPFLPRHASGRWNLKALFWVHQRHCTSSQRQCCHCSCCRHGILCPAAAAAPAAGAAALPCAGSYIAPGNKDNLLEVTPEVSDLCHGQGHQHRYHDTLAALPCALSNTFHLWVDRPKISWYQAQVYPSPWATMMIPCIYLV